MRYTVIDMNLDGGNGDVDTTQKNILLFAPCTEKLAAVNHCNDTNVWVMGHEVNNNHFRAYLVTSTGIDTNAVVSAVGFPMMANVFPSIAGSLKFSPDGNYLCTAVDSNLRRIELFQFNSLAGIISNSLCISNNNIFSHAICFSTNNLYLYIGNIGNNIFQYTLSVYDSIVIINSKILITTAINQGSRYLANGPDSLIHCLDGALSINDSLTSLIQSPNASGIACYYNFNSFNIERWLFGASLPNFNESYFRTNPASVCNTGINENSFDIVKIYPNPARDWIAVRGREIHQIQLINVLGNICIDERVGNSSSVTINTSSLARGIYFLRVFAGNQMASQKIILN